MPVYSASFADGTAVTRSSPRALTHAYRVRFDHPVTGQACGTYGFAGSYRLAKLAANGFLPPRRRGTLDTPERQRAVETRTIEIVKVIQL